MSLPNERLRALATLADGSANASDAEVRAMADELLGLRAWAAQSRVWVYGLFNSVMAPEKGTILRASLPGHPPTHLKRVIVNGDDRALPCTVEKGDTITGPHGMSVEVGVA